jgi:monoamine oxidase
MQMQNRIGNQYQYQSQSPQFKTMTDRKVFDVVIVGAGCAGMRAAAEVASADGVEYVVLEAASEIGGRLRRVPDSFAPRGVALDAGGEVAHGNTTELTRLCAAAGVPLEHIFTTAQGDGGPDDEPVHGLAGYYYYHAAGTPGKRLYRFDQLPEDAVRAHTLLQSLGETTDGLAPLVALSDAQRTSLSVGQYLHEHGVTGAGVLALLDAGYSNTVCAPSMGVMSLGNTFAFEQNWGAMDGCATSSDLHTVDCQHAMADAMRALTSRVDWARVRVNSPVVAVEQLTPTLTRVSCANGAPPVLARVVIVAVPLKQLQGAAIRFAPPLEQRKRDAIASMPLHSARKVLLKYRAIDGVPPIWPADCESCIYAEETLPESWFHPNVLSDDGHRYHIVVGFSTAKYRDAMAAQFGDNDAELARSFDAQLRRVFGPSRQPPPDGHFVFDWSRDAPYVGMGYSHPAQLDGRFGRDNRDLWTAFAAPEPAARRVWAGEYTAYPHAAMTLHAALFSGKAAAHEALAMLRANATPSAKL